MSQSSRWKSQGGMNRRPTNNIVTNNNSHSNILNARTFGTEYTTIDKVADLRDVETASIYRFDPNKTNFANVVSYYPFNDLSYNTPIPSETTNTDISNQSLAGNLPKPQPFPLEFKSPPSISGTFYRPKVAYNDLISQNVIQLDPSSQVLATDLSFNTKNAYDTSGSTISAALTMSCFVNIPNSDVSTTPGQSKQFCLFAMDDLNQTALQKFSSTGGIVNGSDNLLYLWYPNKNGKAQLLYGYKGNNEAQSWSYSSQESIEQIPTDKWTQVFLVLAGLSIYVIVDGKPVFTSSGSEIQGASYVPDQPFNINLGPYYYDYGTDLSANLTTTNTATPFLSDCKVSNWAVGPQLASALASEGEYGHQYSVNEEPNKSGQLYYLLSKELVSFSTPTLFRSDLNLGGDLQSYGTNNFYGQSNFYTKTYFADGIIADGSSTIVFESDVGNANIFSQTQVTTEKNASLFITNSSETVGRDFMASMLVFNDNIDIYNNVQKSNLPTYVDKLQFSISGENVSVGHGFGDSSFNVFGDSVMDGNLSFTNGYIGISQDTDFGPIRIGNAAGNQNQGNYSVAIGNNVGQTSQGTNSVALGNTAGQNSQGNDSVAIGQNAASYNQGQFSVAIGLLAGQTDQSNNSVAIGSSAGQSSQSDNCVAIGNFAGYTDQSGNSVAIGNSAGLTKQSNYSIAIGNSAGLTDQGAISVAIGSSAGQSSQSDNCVAIGSVAGSTNQGVQSVAIGPGAGSTNQYQYSVAIGYNAGTTDQSQNSVAIGNAAGSTQSQNSVAIGNAAGQTSQGQSSVAMGFGAGQSSQKNFCVAIGNSVGQITQGENSVAIGSWAGNNNQGVHSVAIGDAAGQTSQGEQSVAMGYLAGETDQRTGSVAMGYQAGKTTQGQTSVAMGYQAGKTTQGQSSVAMGYQAALDSQGTNSVAIGSSTVCPNSNSVALGSGATTTSDNQIVLGTASETVLIPGILEGYLSGSNVSASIPLSGTGTEGGTYNGRYFCIGNLLIQFSDFSSSGPPSRPVTSNGGFHTINFPYAYDTNTKPYAVILTPTKFADHDNMYITLQGYSVTSFNFHLGNNSGNTGFIAIGPKPSSL